MKRFYLVLFFGLLGCQTGPSSLVEDPVETPSLGELLGILVTPEVVILPVGQSMQLQATGLYGDHSSNDLTPVVTWTSSSPGVATVSDGLDEEGMIFGVGEGTVEISAFVNGIQSVPVQVQVTEETLDGLTLGPASVTIELGQQVELSVMARFSDGSMSDASAQVRWITNDGSIALFEEDGVLTASGIGKTEVYAQWDDISSQRISVDVLETASPDLKVTDVTSYGGDDFATVTVTIANEGNAGASGFWVDAYIDPSNSENVSGMGDEYERISYIGPNGETVLSFTFDGVTVGSHEIAILVDTEGEVSEGNESNNWGSTTVMLDAQVLAANLIVESFHYIADDTDIFYQVEIGNYGDEPTGPFYVDLFIDETFAPAVGDVGDEVYDAMSLGPWETVAVEFVVEQTCYWCWSWIVVDSDNEVEESDELDNVLGPLNVASNSDSL